VLGEGELADLAAVGRLLEQHFGSPQDLEWAIAGGRVSLLQSRPVTTL
jgi:pyruvate,water dikinase